MFFLIVCAHPRSIWVLVGVLTFENVKSVFALPACACNTHVFHLDCVQCYTFGSAWVFLMSKQWVYILYAGMHFLTPFCC